MTFLTAVVIVFAMAGAPIANAVCVVACHGQRTTGACEESMAEPTISSGTDLCPSLVGDTPFVREDGRIALDTSASVVAQPLSTALTPGWLSGVCADRHPVDGRITRSVVLRL